MAQTPQSEAPGGAGETAAPGPGRPPGLFGSSTTILLLIFAVAVFWWNRRRRVEIEERLRAQRREADAAAQRSALDVAHLMRGGSRPAAAAVVDDGCFHEACTILRCCTAARRCHGRLPDAHSARCRGIRSGACTSGPQGLEALEVERAEARAAAERAAEEQAERARRAADLAGESACGVQSPLQRRQKAEADTVDAEHAGQTATVPAGAILGDGTANCPPDYPIKGNRQSRIYHTPGQVSYPSTIAEYCFVPRRKPPNLLAFGCPGHANSVHRIERSTVGAWKHGSVSRTVLAANLTPTQGELELAEYWREPTPRQDRPESGDATMSQRALLC